MTEDTQTNEATTDIATLPPAERAMIVLGSTKTETQLREMVEETKSITEVKDAAGREQAHRAGMKLRTARTTIEKTGKAARDDATKFSKAVIDEEKRLIAITEAEERRVLALRDAFDAAAAAEKAAREAADKARKDEIKAKIEGIRRLPLDLANETAEGIAAERDALAAFEPSEEAFQEFLDECKAALAEALQAIQALYDRTKAREDADAALAVERERLAEERRALEAEREAQAARQAEADAENARLRAQLEALSKVPTPVAPAGADTAPAGEIDTHPNGAPKFSATVFKDNGEPIMLNADGTRSVFCDIADDDEPAAESGIVMFDNPTPVGSDWRVRSAALATADQFDALADKVDACGVPDFANQLRAVAYGLREGDHDAKIAAADVAVLIEADNRLLDATVKAVDCFAEQVAA